MKDSTQAIITPTTPTTATPTTPTTSTPAKPATITPTTLTTTAPNNPTTPTTPAATHIKDKANTPICTHFQRGDCRYGEHCWKSHKKLPLLKDVTIIDGKMVYICPKGTHCKTKHRCNYYHPANTTT